MFFHYIFASETMKETKKMYSNYETFRAAIQAARDRDRKNCVLYIINGIIVTLFDCGMIPTAALVRSNFNFKVSVNDTEITDTEIDSIISKVQKYY